MADPHKRPSLSLVPTEAQRRASGLGHLPERVIDKLADQGQPTAVFDFDGTLTSGDCFGLWLRLQFALSGGRKLLGYLLAPFALTMLKVERWRRSGVELLLWGATVRRSEAAVEASFKRFSESFLRGELPLRWNETVCARLDECLRNGERVVVVTAAPLKLAMPMLRARWPRLAVFGSTLKPHRGGLVGDFYCRGEAKLQALARKGISPPFAAVYSDSHDDWPLFGAAQRRVFVGDHAKSLRLLEARLLPPHERI